MEENYKPTAADLTIMGNTAAFPSRDGGDGVCVRLHLAATIAAGFAAGGYTSPRECARKGLDTADALIELDLIDFNKNKNEIHNSKQENQ